MGTPGEVLRLALLGIAGVGFLLDKSTLLDDQPVAVVVSLACFSLAAACALGHRYLVTHALMYYFFGLRIRNSGTNGTPPYDGRHLPSSATEKGHI